MSQKNIAIVSGVGQGFGEAVCTQLSRAGYHVVGLARTMKILSNLEETLTDEGGAFTGVTCNLLDEHSILQAFNTIKGLDAPISAYIHNAGQFVMDDFFNLSAQAFEETWRLTTWSAFVCAQHILPHMVKQGSGTIIFTGATASIRGASKFATFASAKFALRGLAQSLAREFGPQGVHIVHAVLDGVVDCDWTKARFGISADKALLPEAIAQNYLALINQHRSTWTHELDLRPDVERF